jgi:hypothetical protein
MSAIGPPEIMPDHHAAMRPARRQHRLVRHDRTADQRLVAAGLRVLRHEGQPVRAAMDDDERTRVLRLICAICDVKSVVPSGDPAWSRGRRRGRTRG